MEYTDFEPKFQMKMLTKSFLSEDEKMMTINLL